MSYDIAMGIVEVQSVAWVEGEQIWSTETHALATATLPSGVRYVTMPLEQGTKVEDLGDPDTKPALWYDMGPVYGSDAWGVEDEAALKAFD